MCIVEKISLIIDTLQLQSLRKSVFCTVNLLLWFHRKTDRGNNIEFGLVSFLSILLGEINYLPKLMLCLFQKVIGAKGSSK